MGESHKCPEHFSFSSELHDTSTPSDKNIFSTTLCRTHPNALTSWLAVSAAWTFQKIYMLKTNIGQSGQDRKSWWSFAAADINIKASKARQVHQTFLRPGFTFSTWGSPSYLTQHALTPTVELKDQGVDLNNKQKEQQLRSQTGGLSQCSTFSKPKKNQNCSLKRSYSHISRFSCPPLLGRANFPSLQPLPWLAADCTISDCLSKTTVHYSQRSRLMKPGAWNEVHWWSNILLSGASVSATLPLYSFLPPLKQLW